MGHPTSSVWAELWAKAIASEVIVATSVVSTFPESNQSLGAARHMVPILLLVQMQQCGGASLIFLITTGILGPCSMWALGVHWPSGGASPSHSLASCRMWVSVELWRQDLGCHSTRSVVSDLHLSHELVGQRSSEEDVKGRICGSQHILIGSPSAPHRRFEQVFVQELTEGCMVSGWINAWSRWMGA